ncbi:MULTISPECIES: hypothetical protein [Paenibacillus]|nr:hypothetical protein [Paenibacillus sp. JMULE4]
MEGRPHLSAKEKGKLKGGRRIVQIGMETMEKTDRLRDGRRRNR